MTKYFAVVLMATFGLALVSPKTDASPITFSYTGHLTFIAALDPNDPFPIPLSDDPNNPSRFSGNYTFDSAAPDGVPLDPQTGAYASSGGPYGLTLNLGGLSFAFGNVDIGVLVNYPFPVNDQYQFGYADGQDTVLSVRLTNFAQTAFSTDALPLTPPPLALFPFTEFFFTTIIDGNQVEVAGVIDSLFVPEPAPWTLALSGLALLALSRRNSLRI